MSDETAQDQGPAQPPAQDGDEHEVAAPVAVPQVLPTVDEGRNDLADNPGRVSVLTEAGHLVRE